MDPDDVYFKGQYDPKDYEHLEVSSDVRELFEFITDFKPRVTDIGTQLDPFIPDFIPAVGDIDAMIKITAPSRIDGVDHQLGLEVRILLYSRTARLLPQPVVAEAFKSYHQYLILRLRIYVIISWWPCRRGVVDMSCEHPLLPGALNCFVPHNFNSCQLVNNCTSTSSRRHL